jgi:hypothetical protein
LSIKKAKKIHELSHEHYYATNELIEVEMSNTQFAELLTSLNHGDGVPVTIRRFNGKMIERCPETTQRQKLHNDLKNKIIKATKIVSDTKTKLAEIFKKPNITKKDKQKINDLMYHLEMDLQQNLPYVKQQVDEAIQKTVLEAKNEIDAAIQHKIISAGIEHINSPVLDSKDIKILNQ